MKQIITKIKNKLRKPVIKLTLRVVFSGKGVRYVNILRDELDTERRSELSQSIYEDGYWTINSNVNIFGKTYNANDLPHPGHPDLIGSVLDMVCSILDARIKLRKEREQIVLWVDRFGTSIQKQRHERGFLPETDVTNAMNKQVFAPLEALFKDVILTPTSKTRKPTGDAISDTQFAAYLEIEVVAKRIDQRAQAELIETELVIEEKSEFVPIIKVTIPSGTFDFIAWYFPKRTALKTPRQLQVPLSNDLMSFVEECAACGHVLERDDFYEPCPYCEEKEDVIAGLTKSETLENYAPIAVIPITAQEAINE